MDNLVVFENETPERAEALNMHFEIMAAAQSAATGLLDLGRKLKKMRDSGRYKELGFDTFSDYTENAVGIRQRQAYTYIGVVEKLPAKLIEENAAAGVTKLALLAKLGTDEREKVATDLANITVADLQKLIDERDSIKQQLSLFQENEREEEQTSEPVPEIDIEAERTAAAEEAAEKVRIEMEEAVKRAEKKAAEAEARAKADAENRVAEAIKEQKKKSDAKLEKRIAELHKEEYDKAQEAIEEAKKQQEEKYKADMEKAEKAAEEQRKRAEELAKEMKLNSDKEGIRFALLFDDVQKKCMEIMSIVDDVRGKGNAETAEKYSHALAAALRQLADQAGNEA